jgi:hypothetical protein
MGYYADTQQELKKSNGYYKCRILADSGDCWIVEFVSESEVDAVHPPLMSASKTGTPLMSKSKVFTVGDVPIGPGIPMHQVDRLQYIDIELAVKNAMLASNNLKRECSKLNKSHVTYCSQISILIIVLSMPEGPELWKRLVKRHLKVNAYLMTIDGYPSLLVDLVSRAMLKYPAE